MNEREKAVKQAMQLLVMRAAQHDLGDTPFNLAWQIRVMSRLLQEHHKVMGLVEGRAWGGYLQGLLDAAATICNFFPEGDPFHA